MKIAIVHDYLKEYGGAESVVEAMLEIWPNTPVYTTIFLPEYLISLFAETAKQTALFYYILNK